MCDNVEYLFVPESNMPDRVLVGSINMSRNHGMVAYVPERTCNFIDLGEHDFECSECGAQIETVNSTYGYQNVLDGDFNYCPNCGAKIGG